MMHSCSVRDLVIRTVTKYTYYKNGVWVSKLDDPRSIGEALKGFKLGDFWKYRVGDDQIIARIEDGALRILVVKIRNRRKVYR